MDSDTRRVAFALEDMARESGTVWNTGSADQPPDGIDAGMDMTEHRRVVALRAYIEQLLASGGMIVSREPLRLLHDGQLYLVAHGMLIGEQ